MDLVGTQLRPCLKSDFRPVASPSTPSNRKDTATDPNACYDVDDLGDARELFDEYETRTRLQLRSTR